MTHFRTYSANLKLQNFPRLTLVVVVGTAIVLGVPWRGVVFASGIVNSRASSSNGWDPVVERGRLPVIDVNNTGAIG